MSQPAGPLENPQTASHDFFAFYVVSESGVLRIGGKDCLNFIQRQTTNDVQKIRQQGAIQTVLTSPTGRIIDILQILALQDEILALTLPTRHFSTLRFLKSRVFFMDKVEIEDISPDFSQLMISGNRAAEVISFFGIPEPSSEWVSRLNWEGSELIAVHQKGKLGEGIRLLIPQRIADRVREFLVSSGVPELSSHQYQIYRIESGIPGPKSELVEDFTPLELDLKELVAENKGCYTGQEVLARQLTYQKITRQLAGLQLSGEVEAGSKLYSGAEPAGELTSFINSPRFGPIGLAVVKAAFHQPGVQLSVRSADREVTGVIKPLPFQVEEKGND